MFERFTAESRRVVVHAQEEARLLGHGYVGSEHILLGLLSDEGLACRALASVGVTLEETRHRVAQAAAIGVDDDTDAPRGAWATSRQGTAGPLPFTPRAKKILERSLRQALRLGSDTIGNEHILLGLLSEPDGAAVAILTGYGVSPLDVRGHVIAEISGAAAGSPRRTRTTIAQERPWALPPERVGVVRIGADAVAGLRILLESLDRRLAAIEAHLGIKAPAEPEPDGGTGEAGGGVEEAPATEA